MGILQRIIAAFGVPTAEKAAPASISAGRDGWWNIMESVPGAWQRGVELKSSDFLSFSAVWSCITLIANDISKLRLCLLSEAEPGVWLEIKNPAYSPVLRKPNHYQNRILFVQAWLISKLSVGNTYVLKVRDGRGITIAMHVLDPRRCRPMVTEAGDVWYEVAADDLAGVGETLYVPASEIIHDRWNCLFHPLVGMSPIYACAAATRLALAIQDNSTWFFRNKSMPSGVLTGPGQITQQTADRIREYWSKHFTGENIGRIAVLGDGLKFEPQPMIASEDAELVAQLKWTSETVAACFHVPGYKIGVGTRPNYNTVAQLNLEYYEQCLQVLMEQVEIALDEGLGLSESMGVAFDESGLLRMDFASLITSTKEAVQGGLMTVNEARKRLNLPAVAGGSTVYLQQQMFSLEALAKRDAKDDPFAGSTMPPAAEKPPQDSAPGADAEN